jgi:hypothetical protein
MRAGYHATFAPPRLAPYLVPVCRDVGLGFRVDASKIRGQGCGGNQGSGFRVQGSGFRV